MVQEKEKERQQAQKPRDQEKGRDRETGRQRQRKSEKRKGETDIMRLKRQKGGRRQKRGWEGVTLRFGGHTGHSRDSTLSQGTWSKPPPAPGSQPSPLSTGESDVLSSWQALREPLSWRGLARPPACSWPRAPAQLPVLASGMSPLTLDEPWEWARCRVGRGGT